MRIWAEIDQICIESLLSKTAVSQNTLSAILIYSQVAHMFVLINNQAINFCWQSNLKLGCTPVCSYKK